MFRLWAAGTSSEKDSNSLVKAISRSGKPVEALGGPFIYCVVLLVATLGFWRDSLISILAISQMAAGDGMADIIGRKYGSVKWPWSKDKSVAGTLGFVAGGFTVSVCAVAWLHFTGCLAYAWSGKLVTQIALITLFSAAVELLSFLGDDNISVPVAAAILSYFIFYAW